MKNKLPVLVLVGAVILGLLASVSVSSYLASTRATNKLNMIVVAQTEIPLGSKITSEHLTTVQMPQGATPDGAFTDMAKVVGRIAATRISAREAVISARLAPIGAVAGLSSIIPEGMRAMTVKVDDDSGMSGFVLPGTFVDVAAVIKVATSGVENTISKIILQNIKVLANGDNLEEPNDKRDAQKARTVTLLVSPEHAEKLLLASSDGRLRLVMRNGVDQQNSATHGANMRTLLDGSLDPTLTMSAPRPLTTPTPASAQPARRQPPATKANTPASALAAIPKAMPTPRRDEIEFFEGMKKRSVEFPEQ